MCSPYAPLYSFNMEDKEKFEPEDGAGDAESVIFERMNNYFLLFFALACYMIFSSLAGLLYISGNAVLSITVPGLAAFVMPLYLLARRYNLSFFTEYRLHPPDLPMTLIVVAITAGSILPVDFLTGFFERNRPADTDYINFVLSIKPKGIPSFLLLTAGIAVISPFAEELLFRGFIQRIFQRNMPAFLAVGVASLLFASIHFSLTLIPGITLLGLVMGYIFLRTGNLTYPFIAHALVNFVSLLRVHLASEESIRLGESSPPDTSWLLASLAILASGIIIFEKLCSRAK